MPMGTTRADDHEIRFLSIEHRAIVGVDTLGLGLCGVPFAAIFARVGEAHNGYVVAKTPEQMKIVAVAALVRIADDAGAVGPSLLCECAERRAQTRGRQPKKRLPIHRASRRPRGPLHR